MRSSIAVPQCKGVDPDQRNKPRRRILIEEAVAFAESKNGKCLSEEVNKNAQKLLWERTEDHQWEASYKNVMGNESWCPVCAGKAPVTIEEMQILAESKGGKCLSSFIKIMNHKQAHLR